MSALDELKAKVKTSYIEECIIWALKTDTDKTAAISELNSLRSERDALREALRWYAEARWGWTGDDESVVCEWPDWGKDPAGFHFKTGGEVASAALAGNE